MEAARAEKTAGANPRRASCEEGRARADGSLSGPGFVLPVSSDEKGIEVSDRYSVKWCVEAEERERREVSLETKC